MKKRFMLDVMYGDADGYETFYYITQNENEINFLTYFLKNYTEDLSFFYRRPSLLYLNKTFKNNEEELIKIVNNFKSLADKVLNEVTQPLTEEALVDDIYKALSEIIDFVSDYFGWYLYHSGMNYHGKPQNYKIEDITGYIEMTKAEVIAMVKEKLDVNIVIID